MRVYVRTYVEKERSGKVQLLWEWIQMENDAFFWFVVAFVSVGAAGVVLDAAVCQAVNKTNCPLQDSC